MKISSSKEKSISTINEIYKRPIIIDFKGKVKRVSIFARFFLLLFFPITFIGLFFLMAVFMLLIRFAKGFIIYK